MTEPERRALAESLWANPLFHDLFTEQEKTATEACIWAKDDDARRFAAQKVRAIQTIRRDCEIAMRAAPERKGAPA